MRILIIKPSSLGDIIHGLQVAAILKKHLPETVIDWVVRDCWVDVISASGLVDKIFLFYRHGGLRKFCKLISDIRGYKYDAVLDMQGLARSGILTLLSHADRKIGRWDAREFSSLAYNEIIERPSGKHAIDILLQFLPKFGILPNFEPCLRFKLPNFSNSEVARYVSKDYILLFPESRRIEKQWPYFIPLAEKLSEKFKEIGIVIVGQNSIKIPRRSDNLYDLTGKTSISDLLSLIENCSLLVANDSAPVHIGAAMGKPVIALFGPTDPEKFGPYPTSANKNMVIARENLNALGVEEVFHAVKSNFDKFLHAR